MTPHQSPERRRSPPRSPAAASPESVDGAGKLPMELIFEILSRVPVRSVCRFRCVSKGWQSLLRDPVFVAAHKSLNAETFIAVSSAQEGPDGGDRELRLMDIDGNDVRVIKGIQCSGLISAGTDDIVCVADDSNDGPSVINPATGKVLVDCPKHGAEYFEGWNFVFGFGRAVPSATYKVLRFSTQWGCEVFSLGDGMGWRLIERPPADISIDGNYGLAVKGVIYFLGVRNKYADTLLGFDIETEEWMKAIESPQEIVWDVTNLGVVTLSELHDTVAMVQGVIYQDVNIWLLQDSHNDIWIKLYTIPMVDPTFRCTPLIVTRDGGKLIFYSTIHEEGQALQVYDLHTKTWTILRRLDDSTNSISLCSLLGPPPSQQRS